ncbi:hypothetical protein GJ496_004588 [Pomphorhynchus laevis]|nr:hypothetical protein GJ496_004588 [Pomphorhynchus laevis]
MLLRTIKPVPRLGRDVVRLRTLYCLQPPPLFCVICGDFGLEGDEFICCQSGCNMWFHRYCAGLTPYSFFLISTNPNAEWACDKCFQQQSIEHTD